MSGIVFGYGSLIFRPDLSYERAEWARLDGWSRRFYQGSIDHRGVPDAPGRVVTLLPDAGASCWGVAYHLAEDVYEDMLERLDRREVGGYDRHRVTLQRRDGRDLSDVLVYVANEANEGYLGPAPMTAMAAQIAASKGPSGHNRDYLFGLADALRQQGIEDQHVFSLEAAVRELSR